MIDMHDRNMALTRGTDNIYKKNKIMKHYILV